MTNQSPAVDRLVREILRKFELESGSGRKWRELLRDLAAIASRDYEAPIGRCIASGELPLSEMQRTARRTFPEFGLAPLSFDRSLVLAQDRKDGLGVVVSLSAYGKPGHPFRGFYVHQRSKRPLIWVNRQHTMTAMGATFAHELGHHYWTEMAAREATAARVFHHLALADHLTDPQELFADSFAAMAGYPHPIAAALFGKRSWTAPTGIGLRSVLSGLNAVERHIHRHYPGDLGPASGLPPIRRLYYLGSMLHFAKVRAAILRITGL